MKQVFILENNDILRGFPKTDEEESK